MGFFGFWKDFLGFMMGFLHVMEIFGILKGFLKDFLGFRWDFFILCRFSGFFCPQNWFFKGFLKDL